jgi:hypothetical protein
MDEISSILSLRSYEHDQKFGFLLHYSNRWQKRTNCNTGKTEERIGDSSPGTTGRYVRTFS